MINKFSYLILGPYRNPDPKEVRAKEMRYIQRLVRSVTNPSAAKRPTNLASLPTSSIIGKFHKS